MNLKTQSTISTITLLLGFVMMTLMIIFEDEPGGIPVLLIVLSLIWKIILYIKHRNQPKLT